jgi:hypothetical protein
MEIDPLAAELFHTYGRTDISKLSLFTILQTRLKNSEKLSDEYLTNTVLSRGHQSACTRTYNGTDYRTTLRVMSMATAFFLFLLYLRHKTKFT